MKILLVEDDSRILKALAEALTNQHYTVEIASDGQQAWDLLTAFTYDLILLDVMLPKIDGITICRKLRQQASPMPIMMLTARDTSTDKVIGLDAGADDYVIKPFDLPELMARIRALLRRGNLALPSILEWGDLHLNPSSCQVTYREELLHLTPKEYSLLELFLRSKGRTLSRRMILDHLWPFEEPPGEETVKVHIRTLRQKLKAAGVVEELIENVYGLGYRLKDI